MSPRAVYLECQDVDGWIKFIHSEGQERYSPNALLYNGSVYLHGLYWEAFWEA